MRRSIARLAILACTVITIPNLSGQMYAGQTLKACKIQPKPLTIRKTSKPMPPLSGSVSRGASAEYKFTMKTDLTADIASVLTDQVKFDLFQLNPPKALVKQKDSSSVNLYKDITYVLAVNNCAGRSTVRYKLTITTY